MSTRGGLGLLLAMLMLALVGAPGAATGRPLQYCAQIPIVGGIPPWGFHTGPPITGATGSFARGHGNIDLAADTVSGILCQVDRFAGQPDRLVIMTVEHHLVYHSHYAMLWGYPGNIMKIVVRVKSSTDPRCAVGTLGRVTLFASYNGVRSDSVQFTLPRGVQRPRPPLPRASGRQPGPAAVDPAKRAPPAPTRRAQSHAGQSVRPAAVESALA